MHVPVYFKINKNQSFDTLPRYFFESWVDSLFDKKVQYDITENLYTVVFESEVDAIVLKIKGIPPEFSPYLEFLEK